MRHFRSKTTWKRWTADKITRCFALSFKTGPTLAANQESEWYKTTKSALCVSLNQDFGIHSVIGLSDQKVFIHFANKEEKMKGHLIFSRMKPKLFTKAQNWELIETASSRSLSLSPSSEKKEMAAQNPAWGLKGFHAAMHFYFAVYSLDGLKERRAARILDMRSLKWLKQPCSSLISSWNIIPKVQSRTLENSPV